MLHIGILFKFGCRDVTKYDYSFFFFNKQIMHPKANTNTDLEYCCFCLSVVVVGGVFFSLN